VGAGITEAGIGGEGGWSRMCLCMFVRERERERETERERVKMCVCVYSIRSMFRMISGFSGRCLFRMCRCVRV